MTRGKIVLVPFPFDDLSASKLRPAVCLTDPVGPYRHVVLAFITSRRPADPEETDLLIETGSEGFSTTGLKVTSVVRLHRLLTVAESLIVRELGRLTPTQQRAVDSRLRQLFAL